jgi:hypothetical protein
MRVLILGAGPPGELSRQHDATSLAFGLLPFALPLRLG